jgi:hypothetical protein
MKKLLATAVALVALSVATHAHAISMPDYFHGEWCGEGGACPNGTPMRVSSQGFTGGGAQCFLERARLKSPKVWLLNFKCTEPGRKDVGRYEETWTLMDEMLVVFIQMKDRLRVVQYLPRTS